MAIPIDEYAGESTYALRELKNVRSSDGPGKLILTVVEKQLAELRKEMELNPRISDNVKEDWRFKAGAAWFARLVLGLPDDAENYLINLETDDD